VTTSPTLLEPLTIAPTADSVREALPALSDLLAGRRALLPVPPGDPSELVDEMAAGPDGRPARAGTLIACTSGSTGTPKGALLRSENLTASAEATAGRIHAVNGAGPGPWLLVLPPHHIAGLQVILRSLSAGYAPAVAAAPRFTAAGFTTATRELRHAHPGEDLHTSLVPTQLARLLDDPEGTAALDEYAAVLVGGAATRPDLVDRARAAGVRVMLTYGSSETAGGMVYDSAALPGTTVDIEEPDATGLGRILLAGPTVADGYRNVSGEAARDAFPRPGVFRTSDLGRVDSATGLLTVVGRSDGAVNSAGLKILPEQVEAALADAGFTGCAAGVPDAEWGEAVAAVVEDPGQDAATEVTGAVREALHAAGIPGHLIPRYVFTTPELPTTGPGKVDRRRVRAGLLSRCGSARTAG
jgi:O-succinylbenzoic acid--CoA ligase